MEESNEKAESARAPSANPLKRAIPVGLVLAGLAVVFALYPLSSEPPHFPPDPNYKLPDEARFLPPETQELLRDTLSRIKPVPSDKERQQRGKRFAKQASKAYFNSLRVGKEEGEPKARYSIKNAIAAINFNCHNYNGCNVHDMLAAAVRQASRKYDNRWRRESIEAANVFDVDSGILSIFSGSHWTREESCWHLIWALVYHRAAEFDDKLKQNYDDQLYLFRFYWEGYVDSLKKGRTRHYGNLIREGSYEQTIKHIDDIFTNIKHIPKLKSYMEFEFHGHHFGGETKPPKPMMSEEERQAKLSVVLDALQYDTANPWDKTGAYDDFANLMGGFNYMINDPFLNQIMIFSTRQHIFEKAAEREKKLSGQDSFLYRELLQEASDAGYIKSHYELLYKGDNKTLPAFLEIE